MTEGYVRRWLVNSAICVALALAGVYLVQRGVSAPSANPGVWFALSGLALVLGATVVEVATLSRLFAPSILRRQSPEQMVNYTAVGAFGAIAGLLLYSLLILISSIDVSIPILTTLYVATAGTLTAQNRAMVTIHRSSHHD